MVSKRDPLVFVELKITGYCCELGQLPHALSQLDTGLSPILHVPISTRAGFNWWGAYGAQLTWGHEVGDCKSLKSRTHITNEKKSEGFGGRPPVGGRPGPPSPLNPALISTFCCTM